MNPEDIDPIVMPIRFASVQSVVASGIGGAVRLPVHSVAKKRTDEAPYCTANEWICGELARFLRMPVPPFCTVVFGRPAECWFVSLDASADGETLPPGDFGRCANKLPHFATGMMMFDIFVMNPDRHEENFWVDFKATPSPRPLMFDHGHALFGCEANKGLARLQANRRGLGQDGGTHGIMTHLGTDRYVDAWMKRFRAIPDFFINSVCHESISMGAAKDEADEAARTLQYRRDNLLDIIKENIDMMKAMEFSLFSPVRPSFA